MQSDPWEQNNVAERHLDTVEELEKELALWAQHHVGREEDELHAVAREGPSEYNRRADHYEGI